MGRPARSIALIAAAFLLMVSGGAAASVNVSAQDSTVWLNAGQDTVLDGQWSCQQSSADHELRLVDPSDDVRVTRDLSDSTSGSFSEEMENVRPPEFGEHDIVLECDAGAGNTKMADDQFQLLRLNFTRLEPSNRLSLYAGDEFKFEFQAEDGVGKRELKNDNSEMIHTFVDGVDLEKNSAFNPGKTASFFLKVPRDADPGVKLLETGIRYTDDGDTVKSVGRRLRMEVKKPFRATVLNRTPENGELSYTEMVRDPSSMSLKAKITRRGQPYDRLSSEDFSVTVKNEKGETVRSGNWLDWSPGDQAGVHELTLEQRPQLDYGKYTFLIEAEPMSEPITNFTVFNYITLTGKMKDASGRPVDAQISATRNGLTYQFENKNQGGYEGNLLPGTYNFTIRFAEATLNVQGVELNRKLEGSISYDEVPASDLSDVSDGITVLNAVGLRFGYPFESASVTLNYDQSLVNFQNVRVFECSNWNFGKRSCWEDFESVDLSESQIAPTTGKVSFPAKASNVSGQSFLMNGFMVVRNTELTLSDTRLGSTRVPVGRSTDFSGNVQTPEGDGVPGVEVNVSVLDSAGQQVRSTSTTTGDTGSFSVPVTVPDSTGTYSLMVSGEKNPYSGFRTTLETTFDTYIERGVEVQPPETIELTPGVTSEIDFTVINTGQAPVEDAKLRVRNLRNDWYSFDQNNWEELSPGQSETATMSLTLPDGYCGETCQEYPQFRAEIVGVSGGEEINDIKAVQTVVTKEGGNNASAATQAQQPQEGGPLSSIEPVSGTQEAVGSFLASQSSLNIALGLLTVFSLVLAGAVKKKKSSSSTDKRGGGRPAAGAAGPAAGGAGASGSAQSAQRPDVSRPEVGGSESQAPKVQGSDTPAGQGQDPSGGQQDETADEGSTECGVCGEEFETESARQLHENAVH